MKGIIITFEGEVSDETKKKLAEWEKKRNERLKSLAEDYRTGKT